MEQLFRNISWHTEGEERTARALAEVERIPVGVLFSSELSDKLASIAEKYKINLPSILADQRHGKRRDIETRSQVGGKVIRRRTVIDVSIPFTGDRYGFSLSPSQSPLGMNADVRDKEIVFEEPDDDNLDKTINEYIDRIERILSALRREVKITEDEYVPLLEQAAMRRKKKIEQQRELDGNRSFPIK